MLDTFLVLSRSRPVGFGISGIPMYDLVTAWEAYEWKAREMPLKEFIGYMNALDSEFQEWHKEKAESEKK